MNYLGYLIYQAERPLSQAELRAVEASRGELARRLSHLLHPRHAGHLRHTGPAQQAARLPEAIAVPDYPPADWVDDTHCECR
jgi:hypothetical protein